jgi:hypothetical protein
VTGAWEYARLDREFPGVTFARCEDGKVRAERDGVTLFTDTPFVVECQLADLLFEEIVDRHRQRVTAR